MQIDGEPRTDRRRHAARRALPGPLAEDNDFWLPARMSAAERINEVSHNYQFLGRLARRVTTLEQASAEIETFAGARIAVERRSHRTMGARLVRSRRADRPRRSGRRCC